jgi:hypothetical protein
VSGPDRDERSAALTAFLEQQESAGYRVETRTATQAVIARRRSLFPLARLRRGGGGDRRLVVSVDSDGAITTAAAEPRRW